MFAIHGELGVAGVSMWRRVPRLAGARRLSGGVSSALAGSLRRAFLLRRRRVPPATACAAIPRRRAASVPRLLAGPHPGLAAVAALAVLAGVGARLDSVVASPHLRPQLGAVPQFGGRLVSDAPLFPLPPPTRVPRCPVPSVRARSPPVPAAGPSRQAASPGGAAGAAAARGLSREQVVVERLRQ